MKFIDANVFLYALIAKDSTGAPARRLLESCEASSPACTSVLVLDEVFWSMRKHAGQPAALRSGRGLLANPGLRVMPVTPDHWSAALELMERLPALKPRDAMHAAVALSAGCRIIVSTDPDFDNVPGLRREAP